MTEFREEFSKNSSLPTWWKTGDGVRLVTTNKTIKDAITQAKGHIKWVSDLENFKLSTAAAGFLERGEISICGRDKTGNATLVWEVKTALKKEHSEPLVQALTFAMIILKKYAMVPKYCEKFNFIVNLNKKTPILINMMKELIKLFQDNFTTYIDKTYIYNTSTMFKCIWKVVEVALSKEDLESVFFVTPKDIAKFKEELDGADLPQLYGGDREIGPDVFWPPYKSIQQPMTDSEIEARGIELFNIGGKSVDKKLVNFVRGSKGEAVIQTVKFVEKEAAVVQKEAAVVEKVEVPELANVETQLPSKEDSSTIEGPSDREESIEMNDVEIIEAKA